MCVRGTEPDPCPAGYYCPTGTGHDVQPCPQGKNALDIKRVSAFHQVVVVMVMVAMFK